MRQLQVWGINRKVMMLGLARMADSLGTSMLIILIPLMVADRQITLLDLETPIVIGILLSAFGIVDSLSQPAVGVWMDKLGIRKPVLLIGLGLYAVCTALFAWSYNFYSMLGLRVLQGIAVALTLPPSMALMTEYSTPSNRGTAMSFYNLMRLIGFSGGPLLAGWMTEFSRYSTILLIGAGAGLVGFVCVLLLVKEPNRIDTAQNNEGIIEAFRALLSKKSRVFQKLAYANLVMATAISLVAALENEFNERLQQTPREFGIAFSALVLTMLVVQIPVGRIADSLGRKVLIVSGLILLVPVTIWMGHVRSTTQFIIARMIQGVGVACVAAPTLALGGDKSSSEQRGRQMSLITMAFGLGIGLGPMIGGSLAGTLFFEAPFYLASVFVLSAAAMITVTVDDKTFLKDPDNRSRT